MALKRWLAVIAFAIILALVDIRAVLRGISFMWFHAPKCIQSAHRGAAANFRPGDLDVDLSGRSFLITGANSGIGKHAALALAEKGGTVHMVCRNPERAEAARNEIASKTGNEKIHVHILDMSRVGDVHRFSQEFIKSGKKLDVLINNAGCIFHDRTVTSEDLEVNFATNTMGYYTLTTELLPLLRESSDGRVIMVSSNGLFAQKLMVDDLQHEELKTPFIGMDVYQRQKRQQLVIAEELAKLHPKVQFSTMDPGWVDTPLMAHGVPSIHHFAKDYLKTPAEGADTIVWLAASRSALEFENGLLYINREPIAPHLPFSFTQETASQRTKLMEQLENISERLKPPSQ